MTNPTETKQQKAKRPLGIWFLTIWDGFFAGLFPLVTVLAIYLNAEERMMLEMTFLDLALSVLLALSILGAAVEAWRGKTLARIALVVLVTIHYGLLAFNNLSASAADVLSDRMETQALARGLRAIFWIIVNLWYFLLSGRTKAFYDSTNAAANVEPTTGRV